MCGLVGISGDISPKGKKAFKKMLEFDTHRGPHSTGVASSSCFELKAEESQIKIIKDIGTPWDLAFSCLNDDYIPHHTPKVVIGHNRWATRGKVIVDNAHPFHYGDWVGAHNGTLSDQGLSALSDNGRFEVDSECIVYNISKHGIEDTISKMNGAWALSLWNEAEETLYLIRNKERPLYVSSTKDEKMILYASEPWMITISSKIAGLEISNPSPLKEDTLYSFKNEGGIVVLDTKEGVKGAPDEEKYKSSFRFLGKNRKYTEELFIVGDKIVNIGKSSYLLVTDETNSRIGRLFIGKELDKDVIEDLLSDEKLMYKAEVVNEDYDRPYFVVISSSLDGPYSFTKGEDKGEFVAECDWCTSDIFEGEEYLEATEGFGNTNTNTSSHFCKSCMHEPMVQDFVTGNVIHHMPRNK